jgi:hypothetical protein
LQYLLLLKKERNLSCPSSFRAVHIILIAEISVMIFEKNY